MLWHSNKSMTARYSMAQIPEKVEAPEKIKEESSRWNVGLQRLMGGKRSTAALPAEMTMG